MRKLISIFSLIAALLPVQLLAHGYWIELEGSHKVNEPVTVKLIFGEYMLAEKLSGEKLDRMKDIKVFVILPDGTKQAIVMTQLNDCWKGQYTPAKEGTYTITGINNEREVQDWTKHGLGITRPIQYLKASYTVGTTNKETSSGDFIDMLVAKKGSGTYELQLLQNKLPVDTCIVTIVSPDGKQEEVKTSIDGKAIFTATRSGMYLIGLEWVDKNAGTFKGKEYKTIRHKMDYSLYVN